MSEPQIEELRQFPEAGWAWVRRRSRTRRRRWKTCFLRIVRENTPAGQTSVGSAPS